MSAKDCDKKPNSTMEGGMKGFFDNFKITPSQALVITGILGGALEVDSILVNKEQEVQILLIGSLKQKTPLEKVMDQIGSMPFDEVMKAMLGRLT